MKYEYTALANWMFYVLNKCCCSCAGCCLICWCDICSDDKHSPVSHRWPWINGGALNLRIVNERLGYCKVFRLICVFLYVHVICCDLFCFFVNMQANETNPPSIRPLFQRFTWMMLKEIGVQAAICFSLQFLKMTFWKFVCTEFAFFFAIYFGILFANWLQECATQIL